MIPPIQNPRTYKLVYIDISEEERKELQRSVRTLLNRHVKFEYKRMHKILPHKYFFSFFKYHQFIILQFWR